MRTVMPDEHEAFLEVEGMNLGESAAELQAGVNELCDASFQVRFAAHRETRSGMERVADDEVRHKLAHRTVGFALIVVSEAVQFVFVDEAFQSDCSARSHGEIFGGDLA